VRATGWPLALSSFAGDHDVTLARESLWSLFFVLADVKAVDVVRAPARDEFVWIGVADFARRDLRARGTAHPWLTVRCKFADATCRLADGIEFRVGAV